MPEPIIIIGGGGHAKVLIDALRLNSHQILGVVDPVAPASGSGPPGTPYLGGNEVLDRHAPDTIMLVNGVGSLPGRDRRRSLFEELAARGYEFLTVIHPSAVIGAETTFGAGVQIMAGAIVQAGTSIGANTIINTGASIDHDCRIGRDVHIAPGAVLCGSVIVGDGAHIATGSNIVQSITIGANAVIGAGSTIVHDVADGAKVIPSNS
jgi:UDP-perosamine 4-acetyltransferase